MAFDIGGAMSGASSGAQMGSAAGPYGAAAGAIIGGLAGGFSGGRAKKKKKKAARKAAEAQRQYGLALQKLAPEVQGKVDPFNPYRAEIAKKLSDIVAGRADWTADPGYQFRLKEANREVERAAAARGYNMSGNVMTALQQRSQDIASAEYQNVIARLTELGGATAQNAIAGGEAYGNIMGAGLGAQYGADQSYQMWKLSTAADSHNSLMSGMQQGSSFMGSDAFKSIQGLFGGNNQGPISKSGVALN